MIVTPSPHIRFGDERGPLALPLHGYTDSAFSFSRLAAFPARYHAIVPDQRGHGARAGDDGPFTRRVFARDAVSLLDEVGGGRRAVIVGHSLGALTALRIAAERPERVAGVVLIGGAAGAAGNPALEELAVEIGKLTDRPDAAFIRAFQESTAARPLESAFLDRVVSESARVPLRVWREALADLLDASEDTPPRLVEAPVLAIWGEEDGVFGPRDRTTLLDSLPNVRSLVVPGVGHAPHWETPREVAEIIDRFVIETAEGIS